LKCFGSQGFQKQTGGARQTETKAENSAFLNFALDISGDI
jgi:hypothetical protein